MRTNRFSLLLVVVPLIVETSLVVAAASHSSLRARNAQTLSNIENTYIHKQQQQQQQQQQQNGYEIGADATEEEAFWQRLLKTVLMSVPPKNAATEMQIDMARTSKKPDTSFYYGTMHSSNAAVVVTAGILRDNEIVQCGTDFFTCPDGQMVGRDATNFCNFFPCRAAFVEGEAEPLCALDMKTCPDGSFVLRDEQNICEFFPCLTNDTNTTTICPEDVRECSDGSVAKRDPINSCEFFPCPISDAAMCAQDVVMMCPDGSLARRVGPDCEFEDCPEAKSCPLDVMECPDGSSVGRDPESNCTFFPCPRSEEIACTRDVQECPDGSLVSRDPMEHCTFFPCPEDAIKDVIEDVMPCPVDVFTCSDGTVVKRSGRDCEFEPCPGEGGICAMDVAMCPGGSSVGRNPEDDCEFFPCPELNDCPTDVFRCPDGTMVGRLVPECEFEPCPFFTSPALRASDGKRHR